MATVSFDEVIADFGPRVGLRILRKYGGRYMCSFEVQRREIRDRHIWRDHTHGMPDYEIAAKYRVPLTQARSILSKMRRRFRYPGQFEPKCSASIDALIGKL